MQYTSALVPCRVRTLLYRKDILLGPQGNCITEVLGHLHHGDALLNLHVHHLDDTGHCAGLCMVPQQGVPVVQKSKVPVRKPVVWSVDFYSKVMLPVRKGA